MTLALLTPASASPAPPPTPLVPASAPASGGGLSFGEVLDAVNPLQHTPVVSSLYRAVTGSQISVASQVAGDTLYGTLMPGGAVAGLASSLAGVAVKAVTGKDVGQWIASATSSSTAPSASASASSTPAPLLPNAPGAPAVTSQMTPATPAAALMHLSRDTQAGSSGYARAQAFDALNRQLVKMAV